MAMIDTITALCKRRGFVYPSGEIYGGFGGFWDLGPMGVALSNNIKKYWWQSMTQERDDIVGLDSSIITNPKVWEASGHTTTFSDPLIECKICHERFRADQDDEVKAHEQTHVKKGDKPLWTDPRQFNILVKTFIGVIEDEKNTAYLRGETCQGIFINFQNVLSSTRIKVPFGIAQIGKAFRNEVTPGKFLFRVREFEQMEMEYFVHPKKAEETLEYWKKERMAWLISLGLNKEHIRLRQHEKNERAFYASDSWDIEYDYPDWGWKELEGIANRTDYDLKAHEKSSGKSMSVRDDETAETYIPYVVEPSIGVGRLMLALLIDSYRVHENRVVLALNPKIAPYKVAVFPLLANKPELVDKARILYRELKATNSVIWDARGNIGKRYLAQDEVGTPWCVTVDFTTLTDDTVTVRDRDTTKQERIHMRKLPEYIQSHIKEEAI